TVGRGGVLSLAGLTWARILSFSTRYCALAEEIFYFGDVYPSGRDRYERPGPVPLPLRSPATAHRSLAHHDLLQRHLFHAADCPGHAALSAVLGDDRSPDG